jgi:hypothetical protein
MRFPLRPTSLALSFLALGGCDSTDDGTIAGSYETTRFTAVIDGEPVDVLGAGGRITMTLREGGGVSGRLVVPVPPAEDGEGDTPFAGTYARSGSTVTFDHEADTFIRDAVWTFSGGQLRTEAFGLSVVLDKD